MEKSRVKEIVSARKNELALLELQSIEKAPTSNLVSTSIRLGNETMELLDKVCEKLEMSRSEVMRQFLDAALRDALVELGIDPLDWYPSENFEIVEDEENE